MAKGKTIPGLAEKSGSPNEPVRRTGRGRVRNSRYRFAAAFALSSIGLDGLIHLNPPSFAKLIKHHTAGMVGLVLSTPVMGILVATHLLHRTSNVLPAYIHFTPVVPVDLTLLVVGQYLLPVLLLIHLIRLKNQHVPRLR
jgi:hypothetical protein